MQSRLSRQPFWLGQSTQNQLLGFSMSRHTGSRKSQALAQAEITKFVKLRAAEPGWHCSRAPDKQEGS